METRRENQPVSNSVVGPAATAIRAGRTYLGCPRITAHARGPPPRKTTQAPQKNGAAEAPTSTAPLGTPDP